MNTSPYDLDLGQLDAAADWAVHQLRTRGIAQVILEPGDSTRYEILIALPPAVWHQGSEESLGSEPTVTLVNFSKTYPWAGYWMHYDYVAEKWACGPQTAIVLSEYLNRIAAIAPGLEFK